MVALSLSSSLDPSETSESSPTWTRPQRSLHARTWDDWTSTHSRLRHSGDPELEKRGNRMAACCCSPVFCVSTSSEVKVVPGFCRDRLCPTCAHRRSRQTFHALCRHVGAMDSPRFVTLTQKAKNEPLFLSLARLRGTFRVLRKSPVWTEAVKGGVYCIEVTRNAETKLWHVHLHAVLDGTFLAQARLSTAWLEATGDSRIVDIRAIHSKSQVASYITKYISKPQALTAWPAHACFDYARDMAGVRTVHTFGNAHNRNTRPEDDGCIPQRVSPIVSAAVILRNANMGHPLALKALGLLNRMGGTFRRSVGLPQPPDDWEPDPLTDADQTTLLDCLYALSVHQHVRDIPRAVWRMADLRVDECPWK